MNLEQILELYNSGWDIVSHSINHPDFTKLTKKELNRQCYDSQKWLIEHGFNKSAYFIVLPFDSQNPEVLDTVIKYYISTCGSLYGYNAFSLVDLYNMHRLAVQPSSVWNWEMIKSWIDETIKHKMLTIIVIHQIDPESFKRLIDYLYINKVEVLTFDQLFYSFNSRKSEKNIQPIEENYVLTQDHLFFNNNFLKAYLFNRFTNNLKRIFK
jgi:hypothetical protein